MAMKRIGRPPRLTQEIRDRILQEWVEGKAIGTPLPTELEMQRSYGVCRTTIRNALDLLMRGNLIFRSPHGRAVTEPRQTLQSGEKFRGKTIGLSFSKPHGWLDDAFCRQVLRAVLNGLQPTGMTVGLSSHNWSVRAKRGYKMPADPIFPENTAGLMLVGRQFPWVADALESLWLPTVSVDFNACEHGFDSYCFDNFAAGETAARRLYKLGHRRIVGLFESQDKDRRDSAWTERREGFIAACRKLNLPAPLEILMPMRLLEKEPLQQLRELLQRPAEGRPTAVLLPMDFSREVVLLAAKLRLKVPKNLTLMGFSEMETETDLTGMRFSAAELGTAALAGLLRLMRSPNPCRRNGKVVLLKGRYFAGHTHACPSGKRA